MSARPARLAALALVLAACWSAALASPASAVNPVKPICSVAGLFSGIAGKACTVLQNGGKWAGASKKLLSGHVGNAIKTALSSGGSTAASSVSTRLGLAAIGVWVLGGAKFALDETAKVVGETSSPQLGTTWFSSTYWRVAGIAAVLTLPFLFAAAIQALVRSDLSLLLRAALGYLPLAMLAVAVAAPVTMLLLAASDQLSAVVSSAAGHASTRFLTTAALVIGGVSALAGSPFLAFLIGVFVVAAALVLWLELLMREAAVYVIVLMLPLAFAALVWPARRIWAIRAVELLVALILSKFAIVAVLSLGGAAISASAGHVSLTGFLAALVLLIMGAFAPWALLRLLPLTELASGAMTTLRADSRIPPTATELADGIARRGDEWAASTTAQMRRDAGPVEGGRATNGAREGAGAETDRLAELAPMLERAPEGAPESTADAVSGAAGPALGGATAGGHAPIGDQPRERLPGLGPIFQLEDGRWREIPLGPTDEWPPRVWPDDIEPLAPEADAQPAPEANRPPAPPAGDAGPADDPDPTPPRQDPDPERS